MLENAAVNARNAVSWNEKQSEVIDYNFVELRLAYGGIGTEG